jgi:mannose-6-phosphate isomerase
MATSDNVVRAGLTPKFKDVEVLVSMLTYRSLDAPEQIMRGAPFQTTKNSTLYDPPIEEFSVVRTCLNQGVKETINALNGPSILLSTQGKGNILVDGKSHSVDEGKVYFIPPHTSFELESSSENLITFLAYCQV